jgi:hypothetical protein
MVTPLAVVVVVVVVVVVCSSLYASSGSLYGYSGGGVVSKVGGAVAVMEMKVDLPLFSKPVVGLCHSGGSTGHHGKVGASSLRDRYMRSFSRAVIGYPQPRDNSVRLR